MISAGCLARFPGCINTEEETALSTVRKFRLATVVIAATLLTAGCDWNDITGSSKSSSGGAVAATAAATNTNNNATKSRRFHHYNPQAWHGTGSAIVMCEGWSNGMKWCKINGRVMTRHGSQDLGREIWSIYGETGIGGTVQCSRNNQTFEYQVSGGGGIQYGSC